MNTHNEQRYTDTNLHVIMASRNRQTFSCNVWADKVDHHLFGPKFFQTHYTDVHTNGFLEHELAKLLDEIPLIVRLNLWFMYIGSPSHISLVFRQHLDRFPNRGGLYATGWTISFWGHSLQLVHATVVTTVDVLCDRINQAFYVRRSTQWYLERVRQSIVRRCVIRVLLYELTFLASLLKCM